MDMQSLQKMNTEELHKELQEKRTLLRGLNFKVSLDEEKKVRKIRETKKDIARILTLLNNQS